MPISRDKFRPISGSETKKIHDKWLIFGQNGPETLAKNFICHFFDILKIFPYRDFKAEILQIWPKSGFSGLKIHIYGKNYKISKKWQMKFFASVSGPF